MLRREIHLELFIENALSKLEWGILELIRNHTIQLISIQFIYIL